MSVGVVTTLFGFRQRLTRQAFWWWSLATWAVFAILFVFFSSSLGRASTWILYSPFFWIMLALMIKRLHDRGMSGANLLWILLPVLGPLWLLITLGFRAGTEGSNQYGDDPRLIDVDYLTVRTP
jgi:uncharacterized membrane protein YhaH (DUF805 family)